MNRDTIHVPAGGWTVVRVHADVAGVLFGHCHVSFHVAVGMGFVIVSQPDQIRKFKIPQSNLDLCRTGGQEEGGPASRLGRFGRRGLNLLEATDTSRRRRKV